LKIRTKSFFTIVVFAVAWLMALATGFSLLLRYENSPGRVGNVPAAWPAASRIHLAGDRLTLVMLAHPRCPCTRASIGELARLTAQVQNKISAYVLFVTPSGSDRDWQDSALRQSAAEIPGVTVLSDTDGVEAQLFGAETSGHTLVFNTAGQLLFSGGITESRGHAGDNAGENAILTLVKNNAVERNHTFVFGCSLFNHAKEKTNVSCPR
jgi:hypothetical protein